MGYAPLRKTQRATSIFPSDCCGLSATAQLGLVQHLTRRSRQSEGRIWCTSVRRIVGRASRRFPRRRLTRGYPTTFSARRQRAKTKKIAERPSSREGRVQRWGTKTQVHRRTGNGLGEAVSVMFFFFAV